MTDYIQLLTAYLPTVEGRTSWLYLDNRKIAGVPAPLVTCGIGCAVDLAEALTLPWQFDGRAATQDDIARDFSAVKHAPFGYAASFYRSCSEIRLQDRDIDALCERRIATFSSGLHLCFPDFYSYPETAKAGIVELTYGVGLGGLAKYPNFCAAVARQDWQTAANECASNASNPAYKARNEHRQKWFLEAANA